MPTSTQRGSSGGTADDALPPPSVEPVVQAREQRETVPVVRGGAQPPPVPRQSAAEADQHLERHPPMLSIFQAIALSGPTAAKGLEEAVGVAQAMAAEDIGRALVPESARLIAGDQGAWAIVGQGSGVVEGGALLDAQLAAEAAAKEVLAADLGMLRLVSGAWWRPGSRCDDAEVVVDAGRPRH